MKLFKMYWRRTLKKPAIVLLWSSVPFVLTTIYILAFGRSGSIAPSVLLLVDEDKSFISGFVKQAFSHGELGDYVSVAEAATLDQAEEAFRKNKASGALVIPEG
ncbi:MAG: hypothetical protein HY770_04085, partial [Chitinivibrionia bacterium]|nr:hypothetical protein [Chitinivibrionia bacterium]